MRAIRCDNWGQIADLRWADLPEPPAPGPGEVKIKVMAAGVKFAATVIATAGGAEKLATARQHGADYLIDYKSEDIRERVKAIAADLGRTGVDVVYDPVGGACFEASLRSVAWGARILLVGFAGGQV